MELYPANIKRCQHIKTNGTQCGAPALKESHFCFYHQESQPERVEVKGADGKTCHIMVPVFEDASSMQTMVRRVAILLLEDKIDGKKAGQLLYALQIASANLKQMKEEKPRAVQVVIEPEKVKETPLGMTPWSWRNNGHEVEEAADRAAERRLAELNEEWTREYESKKKLIEGNLEHMARMINQHPPVSWDSLYNCFTYVHDALGRTSKYMEEYLEEG